MLSKLRHRIPGASVCRADVWYGERIVAPGRCRTSARPAARGPRRGASSGRSCPPETLCWGPADSARKSDGRASTRPRTRRRTCARAGPPLSWRRRFAASCDERCELVMAAALEGPTIAERESNSKDAARSPTTRTGASPPAILAGSEAARMTKRLCWGSAQFRQMLADVGQSFTDAGQSRPKWAKHGQRWPIDDQILAQDLGKRLAREISQIVDPCWPLLAHACKC